MTRGSFFNIHKSKNDAHILFPLRQRGLDPHLSFSVAACDSTQVPEFSLIKNNHICVPVQENN